MLYGDGSLGCDACRAELATCQLESGISTLRREADQQMRDTQVCRDADYVAASKDILHHRLSIECSRLWQ